MLDRARAKRTSLSATGDEMLYALAGIRSPEDGIAFVQQYGLLRCGPDAEEHRELWGEWETTRSKLNATLVLHRQLGRTMQDDPDAYDWLRRNVTPQIPREGRPSDWLGGAPLGSRDETLYFATRAVQTLVSEGLEGVEVSIVPRFEVDPDAGPGGHLLAPLAPTLVSLAYFRLAPVDRGSGVDPSVRGMRTVLRASGCAPAIPLPDMWRSESSTAVR